MAGIGIGGYIGIVIGLWLRVMFGLRLIFGLRLRLRRSLGWQVLRVAKFGAWRNRTTTTSTISAYSSIFGVSVVVAFITTRLCRTSNCGFGGWWRISGWVVRVNLRMG
jgi:hypothetical protein